jgi:hypothetical protein
MRPDRLSNQRTRLCTQPTSQAVRFFIAVRKRQTGKEEDTDAFVFHVVHWNLLETSPAIYSSAYSLIYLFMSH